MALDPITLEVLRNKFDVIADEMEIALLRSAYSSIVKEGMDASAALFTLQGETIAQAASIPIHLGCLVPAVQRLLQAFPPESMQAGDAYIMNDPYDGGSHLPDVVIVVPIFYRGRPVALSATMAHHQDIGGKTPGSVPTDATEIFQEGLRLPPLKFYEAGRPNATLHALLRANVRIPDIVLGDLHGQLAAGHVGQQRFGELLEAYGVETVLAAIKELMDRAEAMTRERLAAIPDGTYTFADYLDNDGIDLAQRITIRATVTVQGSDIFFDFTGTSPQVRGPLNCVPTAAMAGAYYVLRTITDPTIPNNSGCYRPVHLHLPEGTVVNPRPPAAVNARTATIIRIADVLHGALVQALPGKLPAASSGQLLVASFGGIDPRRGTPYVTSELGAGGVGARPTKDGVDVMEMGPSNCMNIPVEAIEMHYPLRIRRYGLRQDSGGAGTYRGGLGASKVFEATHGDVTVSIRGERFFTPPWGLYGGLPAAPARAWIERADGRREEIPSKRVFTLHAGERLHVETPGGGGYGDPLARDPEAVRQDVLARRVSREAARALYGVVLDAALTVDRDATQRLRATLQQQRGPITWTYDRGPLGKE
ncbi:MAG: N-methylhydantoinase B [Candidatus Tectimicrobiota bacterium]|nr:MAG: N-methylhydantoinase B [Candidatus Tectomicrobia bacterium]